MTVQELIEIERKYREVHKNDSWIINEVGELELADINDDIVFLQKGYIAKAKGTTDPAILSNEYRKQK